MTSATRQMNVLDLSRAIGAVVSVSFPVGECRTDGKVSTSVGVFCVVKDVRKVWNRVDLLVVPESGTGGEWVSLERVERTPEGVCGYGLALRTF